MVGVSCALYLQQKGYQVTLIEKNYFGQETSYGNAGVISRGSIIPLNNPKLWRNLPGYLTNRHPAVRYNLEYLLKHLPWLSRFLLKANHNSTLQTVEALNSLIAPSLATHKKLLQAAGIGHRLRENGWLKLYRNPQSFRNAAYERKLLHSQHVAFECLQADDIYELEPGLKPVFQRAMWVTDTASVDNPGAVVKAYGELFLQRGGRLIKDGIRKITPLSTLTTEDSSQMGYRLTGNQQEYDCHQLVLATGPWANELLKPLGVQIPICYERGYHQHFTMTQQDTITRPFFDVDASYVLTPTDLGLRISTGSELIERNATPSPTQLAQVLPKVKEAVHLGPESRTETPPWLGSRPTTPDARPIIDQLPNHKGIWLALGHQHIGFSTGPVTGQLISDLIAGEQPKIDLTPFALQRFSL